MTKIDDYIEEIFSNFQNTEDVLKVKEKTRQELNEKFADLTLQGMSEEKALLKIKIEFGTKECILFQINETKSIEHFSKYRAMYPKLKNTGLIAIGVVTISSLVLSGTTEFKLQSLVTWVVLIILLVGFEMVVEYIDYWFENRYNFIRPPKTAKQIRKEHKHKLKAEQKEADRQKKEEHKAHHNDSKNADIKKSDNNTQGVKSDVPNDESITVDKAENEKAETKPLQSAEKTDTKTNG